MENTFLSELIDAGTDAFLNLYKVTFNKETGEADERLSSLTVRTSSINFPKIKNTTTTVTYLNQEFQVVTPGFNIDRSITFRLRLDNNYNIIDLLKDYLCVVDSGSNVGNFVKETNKQLIIKLEAESSMDITGALNPGYTWTFYNCYITDISSITYDYSSGNTASINVTFIYSYYENDK